MKILKKCLECEKEFETYYTSSKFCCRKCYEVYWKAVLKPSFEEKRKLSAFKSSFKRKTGLNLYCAQCNKLFYKPKYRLNTLNNFCCKSCSDAFKVGKTLPIEHRIKIKDNNSKYWLGKKRCPETIEMCRIGAIRRLKAGKMPSKETSIEISFKNELLKRNILFEQQKVFELGVADFYLPDIDTYIFCDGNYWHKYPNGKDKDSKQISYLKENGHNVFRFWETDIQHNIGRCMESIVLLYK